MSADAGAGGNAGPGDRAAVVAAAGRGLSRVVIAVVIASSAAWLLSLAAPGSTDERVARAAGVWPADDSGLDPSERDRVAADIAREYGADRGAAAQTVRTAIGVVTGDFGRSWRDGAPVASTLWPALARTAALIVPALLLAIGLGLVLGVSTAVAVDSRRDRLVAVLSAVALSVPPVWLGMILLRSLGGAGAWPLFPAVGLSPAGVVLPTLAIATVPLAVVARHARASLLEARRQPWATATLARGVSEWVLIGRHAVRASSGELLPLFPGLVAYVLGSSMVVEVLFGIRGIGALLTDAAGAGDVPTIAAVAAVTAAVVALASLAADVAIAALDPRRRGPDG